MLKRKIAGLKWTLTDLRSRVFRNHVPKHKGNSQHELRDYQVYPSGGNLSQEFFTQPSGQFPKIIDKTTPITSIGSCFAVEIRHHLRDAKFNFINTQESWAGSAEWGRVYTTKNLLQIFQYTFTEFLPNIRIIRSSRGYYDPYREGPFFETEDAAEQEQLQHYKDSRKALTECEVLIVTPGQNEAWIERDDGLAWVRRPQKETREELGEDRFSVKRFTLEENIKHLSDSLALLWANNPETKVIFTLSPVPSDATFYDTNVAVRSIENKAILLLAIKEVVAQHPERAYYFPSFEMTMLSHNVNLQLDNRHVRPNVVKGIMANFDQQFVKGN